MKKTVKILVSNGIREEMWETIASLHYDKTAWLETHCPHCGNSISFDIAWTTNEMNESTPARCKCGKWNGYALMESPTAEEFASLFGMRAIYDYNTDCYIFFK